MRLKARYLSLGIFILLTAVPLALGMGYALLYSLGLIGILNHGFTLLHWQKLFLDVTFIKSFLFSAWVAIITILISVGLAMAVVARFPRVFHKGVLSFFIYLPLVFPAMVVAFYTFQMLSKSGVLSRVGFQIGVFSGLDAFPSWINDNWGIGIIAAHVFMATPFFVILFSNLYQNERLDEYTSLAATLGATQVYIARKVIIPVLLYRSFATLVLYFVFVLSSYEIPLLLGSQSRQMISVLTIQKLQRFNLNDIPQAYAISVLYGSLVIISVSILLKNKRIVKD